MAAASSIAPLRPPDAHRIAAPPGAGVSRIHVLLEWLAGQPLVPPALGLSAGIALDAAWHVPFVAAVIGFAAAGVAIVRLRDRDGGRHLAILIAAFCIGAMLHDASYRRWPTDALVRYCGARSTPACLRGTVLSTPLVRAAQTGRIAWFDQKPATRLLLSADSIAGIAGPIAVSGTVAVKVSEPLSGVRAGDRVEVFGRMYRPLGPDGSDGRDWARIARRNGVLVEMRCDHAANVTLLAAQPQRRGWRGLLAAMRSRARLAMLDRTWPGDVAGANLLQALVLGQRSAVDPAVNQAFVDTGTVHYLSVSGAHVGMLAGAMWAFAVVAGLSRRATAFWIALLITAYGVLAEPNPPVWRSVIMGDVLCAGVLLRRPVRVANWLALSAIILLICHPTDLFDPGFQMSFGTLIALLYLGPPIGGLILSSFWRLRGASDPLLRPEIQRLFNPHPLRRAGWFLERFAAMTLGVGISAWLAGLAWGAYHFHQVSLWGWLNSLLLAPVVWVVLVIGLIKTVLGWLWPVDVLLGPALALLTDLLIAQVELLSALPGSPLPPMYVSATGVAAFTLLLAVWMLRGWLRLSTRWLAIGTLGFAVTAAWRMAPRGSSDELRIDVLSVGSGSAHLVRLPNGRTLLYDAGARPPYNIQRWTLAPLMARSNIYWLDALVLSHPDLDHFSSVPDLLERTWVRGMVTSEPFEPLTAPGSAADRLVREMKTSGVPWQTMRRGQTLGGTGVVQVTCLWPPPVDELPARLTTNDASLVLRIEYQGRRVLLCGDIEDYAQRRLIAEADLRADVLVLPHHGAVTTFTGSFIEAVRPAWCIRSSGQRDAETQSYLPRLMEGLGYLNTADRGDVTIIIRGGRLEIRTARPPA